MDRRLAVITLSIQRRLKRITVIPDKPYRPGRRGDQPLSTSKMIFMMPAFSSCFFCGYPAFFPTESSLGTRTVLRPQKFLKSNLETGSSRIIYRKIHLILRLVCKDPMFFYLLSHLENEKFTIYEKVLFFA